MKILICVCLLFSYTFSVLPTPFYYNSFDGLTSPGKYGNALYLNNAASYNMDHLSTDTNWTIAFWCKVDTVHHKSGIFAFGSIPIETGTIGSYKIKLGSDLDSSGNKTLSMSEPDSNVKYDSNTTPGITLDEWMHVTFSTVGKQVSVYYNGTSYATYNLTETKTALQYFGLPDSSRAGRYHLDELRIYNISLTTNQVNELYSLNPASDSTTIIQDSLTSIPTYSLIAGNTLNLSTLITNPKWFSMDSSIATIDSNGTLTGISQGTVKIGVMDKNNIAVMRTISFHISEASSIPFKPTETHSNNTNTIWDIRGKSYNSKDIKFQNHKIFFTDKYHY